MNSQVDKYLGGFGSSQRIFPPQIIQVLLICSLVTMVRAVMRRVVTNQLFDSFSDIAVEASETVIGVWEIFIDVPCRRRLTRVDPATGLHQSFGPA